MAVRSRSIDALYRNIKTVWPGVVIGWIGDQAHAQVTSDHNPDDTAGVRAAQTDPDTVQEVRALDVMLGAKFTRADADGLVLRLTGDPASRARMYYVIWYDRIWHRADNWRSKPYQGTNRHTTHVHISGWAGDDANGADWAPVLALGDAMALRDDADFKALMYRVKGLVDMADPITFTLPNGTQRTEANPLAQAVSGLIDALAGIANRVEELAGMIGQGGNGSGPTVDQIADELGARLSTE